MLVIVQMGGDKHIKFCYEIGIYFFTFAYHQTMKDINQINLYV